MIIRSALCVGSTAHPATHLVLSPHALDALGGPLSRQRHASCEDFLGRRGSLEVNVDDVVLDCLGCWEALSFEDDSAGERGVVCDAGGQGSVETWWDLCTKVDLRVAWVGED